MHIKFNDNNLLADAEIGAAAATLLAMRVARQQEINAAPLIPSGNLIRSLSVGSGDVIVMTGSASGSLLAFSTSKTVALITRFRYVAEMTPFSSSTKRMAEFMLGKRKRERIGKADFRA